MKTLAKTISIRTVFTLLATSLILTSCEDPIPDDYFPEVVIEGFAIAGEPLDGIKIYLTQPIQDTFKIENAMIRDAQVVVLEEGQPIEMAYFPGENGGFYGAADTSFRVKFNTTYDITVQAFGRTLTASAETKGMFDWVDPPKEIIQYPGRENETLPVDSLRVSWEGTAGTNLYVIAVECQDTSGYGEYFTPPTEDTNRRIRDDGFDEGTLVANERTIHGISFVSNTPTVWTAFKWFGPHVIKVYTGDRAYQNWFSQVGFGRRSSYDYRRSNIEGGLGVWAGASVIESPSFLLKDVP